MPARNVLKSIPGACQGETHEKCSPAPAEAAIAKNVMTIMRDRDVIQLGIGALPSACVAAMADASFKDLGVHTEMLDYGLIKLIESGQVTTGHKNLDRGRSAYTFAFPSLPVREIEQTEKTRQGYPSKAIAVNG